MSRGLLAVTKPSRENVYSAISSLEAESITNHLLDAESRSQITAKMQKEAETFFDGISEGLPEGLIGMMVYSLISDVDVASAFNEAADSESATQITLKLQKEAETFSSSIVMNVPRGVY